MTAEHELIRRAQAGDLEAFCRLAALHERRVYSLALHFCRRPEDAEDLSQEVWLKAFRSISGFEFRSGFYTWLRQILVNSFLNHARSTTMTLDGEKTAVKLDSLEDFEGDTMTAAMAQTAAESEGAVHRRLMVGRVYEALGELTPQQRLVFLLKHRDGMTCREIAETFGCSTGSVKKSLFRSLVKLRSALGVRSPELEPMTAGE
ncbi:MAG TPA: sigma-70 family RNA polymerase sigma factor [Pyrinomonadaceae bacterium]|nr:sigma-70 family RNA polymerase sigma factor [Pyrinomonadaceae bacterium]